MFGVLKTPILLQLIISLSWSMVSLEGPIFFSFSTSDFRVVFLIEFAILMRAS